MLESTRVREIQITADELVAKLLSISRTEDVCILDSSGVGHLGSHLLIAGIRPTEALELSYDDPERVAEILDTSLSKNLAAVFTLSYDFGVKLQRIAASPGRPPSSEPDVFLALFDSLVVHDYTTGQSYIVGRVDETAELLKSTDAYDPGAPDSLAIKAVSDFTRAEYVAAVETIREHIRSGDTYQTNLTQQIRCPLPKGLDAPAVFERLRKHHPAPFAAFIKRRDSTVVSASPERFFRIDRRRLIEASPIKGTRPRGKTDEEDRRLRRELELSEKDRAENTMIVDLMRNDLGRICEYGSVKVEKLCDIEEHPTLFHLVSTVRGQVRGELKFSHFLRALFPNGSITGAPKVRTMKIIDEIEHSTRGLSMGAIGMFIPSNWDMRPIGFDTVYDLSVAIRTMVVKNDEAVFNVGGGVVIDSDPEKEFEESLLKAKALLNALHAEFDR